VIVCFCNAEAQDAYSEGGSPHKSIVSDDADELYGDSIDEDTQSVKPPVDTAPAPSTSGELHGAFYEDLLLCPAEPIKGGSLFLCIRGLAEPFIAFLHLWCKKRKETTIPRLSAIMMRRWRRACMVQQRYCLGFEQHHQGDCQHSVTSMMLLLF